MKYIIFAGDNYYPLGGIKDIKGSTNFLVKALIMFDHQIRNCNYDWVQLVEVKTLTIVKEYEA